MITLKADFNHMDPQGRLRLGIFACISRLPLPTLQ